MEQTIERFLTELWQYYHDYGRRGMAWRQPESDGRYDSYKILVSEVMLQQTQVPRVEPKYAEFIESFPTVIELASSPLGDVLQHWSGLGYNRRAKYLWQAAQMVVTKFGGTFPHVTTELQTLPGVGPNTAGAILAYAYDQPIAYIETNIRTVIIHHFFQDQTAIADPDIRSILEQIIKLLPSFEPGFSYREFYWAMMDYGAYLKKTVGNLNRASKTYSIQSVFQGSRRQLRGHILRLLTERPYDQQEMMAATADDRTASVLVDLAAEGLIVVQNQMISLH